MSVSLRPRAPSFGRSRPNLGDIGPNSAETGPKFHDSRQRVADVECTPHSVNFSPILADAAPIFTFPGQVWPNLAETTSVELRPTLTNFGRVRPTILGAELDPPSVELGARTSSRPRDCPNSAFGQSRPGFAKIWANCPMSIGCGPVGERDSYQCCASAPRATSGCESGKARGRRSHEPEGGMGKSWPHVARAPLRRCGEARGSEPSAMNRTARVRLAGWGHGPTPPRPLHAGQAQVGASERTHVQDTSCELDASMSAR